jgi:hypothetical protein
MYSPLNLYTTAYEFSIVQSSSAGPPHWQTENEFFSMYFLV